VINNVMSNHMFQLLEQQGVPTHFVEQLSERETLVKKVSIVPLEVVIRNIYRVCFQRPKQRPYKTNNFYAVLERQNQLDREVYQIVRKEKADPRRTKTDRSRHRKSEPNG
uniref:phosphoribosylaminoimidazolesuccinocarboxamide synthase n=1 Tax=Hominenteromicrobium sp. TaxID=3073581 RepID=UPI003AEF2E52